MCGVCVVCVGCGGVCVWCVCGVQQGQTPIDAPARYRTHVERAAPEAAHCLYRCRHDARNHLELQLKDLLVPA